MNHTLRSRVSSPLSLIPVLAISALGGACVTDAGDEMSQPHDSTESTTAEELTTTTAPLDVFITDNALARNAVLAFRRTTTGGLVRAGRFPTGGLGTGAGLGSQGAIALVGSRLFVVNAGSDEISILEIHDPYLVLRDIVASGGANPVSLTVHGHWLYVVNAGRGDQPGNISGFDITGGQFQPIAASTQPLSAAMVGPEEIQFDPTGTVLVVTEKATNSLTTYPVDAGGVAGAPIVTPSHGQTPFGFSFEKDGTLVVSEAFGGAPGASAVSSYRLDAAVPQVISGSVPTGQTAACWIALTANGRYAYATNTATNTVSGYSVDTSGQLVRFDDGGATANTAAGPTDADFDAHGHLYVLDAHAHKLQSFTANSTGALLLTGGTQALPAGSVGLVAR